MKFRSNLLTFLSLFITVILVQGNDNSLQSVLHSTDDQCPPWHFYNLTNKQCECYSNAYTDDIVTCIEHDVLLRFGFCMTFEEGDGFYVGPCYYFDLSKYNFSDKMNYIRLPRNVSELNHYMCAPLNRTGILCGQCINGSGPSVTSTISVRNTMSCEKCHDFYWLSLLGYLLLELLQVLVVYFIVLLFRVKFNSAPLMVFVLLCQIQEFSYLENNNTIQDAKIALLWRVLIIFYGICNLDFCRYIVPAFCVSPSLKPFEIAYLNYIPFIYLLLLLIFTWVCIKLHSNNFRLIIWLWNKLHGFFISINTRWDEIIDAFATVFLLAYTKLVFTSIWTTIPPILAWKANNSLIERQFYVYLDPDIEFYGEEHLPSVIISSFITFFIVLPLPILLALYPCRWFRSLLFKCPIVGCHMGTINTYLDKFYSCYRDGLDGGRDMRSFVSLYYFIYWLFFGLGFVAALLQLLVNIYLIVFAMLGFLIAIVRPYKSTFMNVADALILANLALFSLMLGVCNQQKTSSSSETCYILLSVLNMIIPLAVIIYNIISIKHRIVRLVKNSSCCRENIRDIHDEELLQQNSFNLDIDDVRETPDHLLHSEQQVQENNYGSTEQSLLAQSYP